MAIHRLVDCLTLWLTNLMLGGHDWRVEADRLVVALSRQQAAVLFVTNEVGAGIVPGTGWPRVSRRGG
ncbi:MAG: bifunctional adenosylcobinamide kinase/adenosylcobinamide-phosphate guanylyltransferase [Paracoccaceae bacterium]